MKVSFIGSHSCMFSVKSVQDFYIKWDGDEHYAFLKKGIWMGVVFVFTK
jgi:hypothetical protein